MAFTIFWADGFDHQFALSDMQSNYAQVLNYGNPTGANLFPAGRISGRSISLNNAGSGLFTILRYQGFPAQSDITAAFATYNPVAGANTVQAIGYAFLDAVSGTVIAYLDLQVPNYATVVAGGVTYTAQIPLIPLGNWSHIQFRLIMGASGSFEFKLNSQTVFSKTNINTLVSTYTTVSCFGVYPTNPNFDSHEDQIDDLIIGTGGFPGDCHIYTTFPSANNAVQFTPLAGTNFSEVNESFMDSNTSYNYSVTAGQQDTFTFSPVSLPTNSNILAVGVVGACSLSTSGARTYENVLISGASTVTGVAFAPGASYSYVNDFFQNDPATGAAWTGTAANAVKAGYKVAT